jgi:hypothetical protein
MDHAAHITEMRNVCQIRNKSGKGNTMKVCLYMGRKCQQNMFLNFCIGVDEVCVLLGYDVVSCTKGTDS